MKHFYLNTVSRFLIVLQVGLGGSVSVNGQAALENNSAISPERFEELGLEPSQVVPVGARPWMEENAARVEARRYYMIGAWQMASGQARAAFESFEKALDKTPDSAMIKIALAESLLALERAEDCIEICEEVLDALPKQVEAWLLLGKAHTRMGRLDEAIQAYRKGLDVLPESLPLLEPLADLYRRKWDPQNVIEIYERIHQRLRREQRRNLYVMVVLANFYDLNEQPDKSIEMYLEAVQVYPDNIRIYEYLINALLKSKRFDEALVYCKEGLLRNPMEAKLLDLFQKCVPGGKEALKKAYRQFADEYFQISEIQLMWAIQSLSPPLYDMESAQIGFKRVLEFDPNHRQALLGLAKMAGILKNPEDAITYYRKIIEHYPDEPDAYLSLASIHEDRRELPAALALYDALQEHHPEIFEAYVNRSAILFQMGRKDEAIQALEDGQSRISDAKDRDLYRTRRAVLLLQAGRMDDADQAVGEALSTNPRDVTFYQAVIELYLDHHPEAHRDQIERVVDGGRRNLSRHGLAFEVWLASTYRQHGLNNRAIESLARSVEMAPDQFDLYEHLAILQIMDRRGDEAEVTLDRAAEKFGEPESWRVALLRGDLYVTTGQYAKILKSLKPFVDRLLDSSEIDTSVRVGIARSYAVALANGDKKPEAVALVNSALNLARGKDRVLLLRILGLIHCDAESWSDAQKVFERLIEIEPDNSENHYRLGTVYDMMDDSKQAEVHLRRALEINPNDAVALNHLGYMLVQDGRDIDEAMDLIRRALAIEPGAAFIIDSLGWAYYKKGDYEKAVYYLEKAVNFIQKEKPGGPGDAEVLDHLGDALQKLGQTNEAIEHWEKALNIDTDNSTIRAKLDAARQTTKNQ